MTGILANVLVVFAVAFLAWTRLRTLLTYFQQEEYNSNRFVSAVFRVRLFDVRASALLLILAIWQAAGAWSGLAALIAAAAIAIIGWREQAYRFKKPLVMTERARRLFNLTAVLGIIPVLLGVVSPLMSIVALQVLPGLLMLANSILAPMQKRINQGFIDSAKRKLARIDPLRIGITGSFGKTTVKHILAEILEVSGPVFYSRGSINTELGLTRHIRQRLQFSHRYFIAEMGAYGIGSVRRLCGFVKPTYGIVTAVGAAHTERFGSIENVAIAKSELAEAVCKAGGHIVLNAQVLAFAPFRKIRADFPGHVTVVGDDDDADVRIVDATMAGGVWTITLQERDGGPISLSYQLPLLGAHNIINSALAVVLALRIDPDIAGRLPLVTKDVEQVPHRLQKRESPGQPLVLDDAFNSNEEGFKNAVRELSQLATERGGRAILVTPGIAELGIEHGPVHAGLAELCNELCDAVYVVNPDRIPTFVAGLDPERVDCSTAASLADARKQLARATGERDVVLYENDLPDLLEERRLL